MTDIAERQTEGQSEVVESGEELGIQPTRFLGLVAVIGAMTILGGWQLLLVVSVLVLFIVIHEAGHYFTAKWSGMKSTEFFIGFGPRIFAWKRGETTYGLKTLPLGAYVRIIGMNDLDEVDPADEPRAYRNAPWHKRFLTVAAGPASHFIMAIILAAFFLSNIGQPVDDEWAVAVVVPFSAAESAGVEQGDQILSIDGVDTTDFDSLSMIVPEVRGNDVELLVERDGEQLALNARIGERLTEVGSSGLSGLYIGDLILGIDGQRVQNYAEFAALASERIGSRVEVEVVYDTRVHTEMVTINSVATENAVTGFLGVAQGDAFEPLGLGTAFTRAPKFTWEFTREVAIRFGRLFSSADGLRGLFALPTDPTILLDEPGFTVEDPAQIRPFEGPDENRLISIVGAVGIGQQLVDEGLGALLSFFFLLNISLGMINVVPLLPFDGGHMAVATYERLRSFGGRRHRVDAAKLMPLTYAVVGLMLLVGGIAIIRDIVDPIQL